MIVVTVNGNSREMATGTTLAELLRELDLKPRGLAVELNGEIVPQEAFSNQTLSTEDRVEIVSLVGGG